MLRAVSRLLTTAGVLLCLSCIGATERVQAAAGLTISPAALTLSLPADAGTQTAEFSLANQYSIPVTLNFAFEPRIGAGSSQVSPKDYLSVGQAHITLEANQTASQTIRLTDSARLAPGSQLADLVITQVDAAAPNVGVLASVRLPLTIIKEDGAIGAISAKRFGSGWLYLSLPQLRSVSFYNNGNLVAIPRGTVTITGPGGHVVRQGVLNVSSAALAPGESLGVSASLTTLAPTRWPGLYHLQLSYGLGGGRVMGTASRQFLYVAWWHLALLVLLGVTAYGTIRLGPQLRQKRSVANRPPPRKVLLIGRDIT